MQFKDLFLNILTYSILLFVYLNLLFLLVLVGQDVLSREYIWLVFHGLDTVATITLNKQTLGDVNNMFVRYRYDVKAILKVSYKLYQT